MNFFKRYIIFSFLFGLFLLNPGSIFAQSVSLTSSKTTYTTTDTINVTAIVQTGGQQINTVGGSASFNPASLSVSDVRYGNSIISLWVLKPTANNSLGTIEFTGGVPGGFSGNSGNLFTFVVKPKSEGNITLTLKDVHVLLNDGSGGELQGLKIIPLTLNITKAKAVTPTTPTSPTEIPKEVPIVAKKDLVAPESFVPIVSRHESIADNAYFVSFFAVDKDSGVDTYEVREISKIIGVSTDWVEATSPFVLRKQLWGSRVEVRATDGAGNTVVSSSDKPFSTTLVTVFVVLLVMSSVVITRIFTKRAGRLRRR